ncbi:GNAT family N-acetyltransferase [Novosphingobium sp. PS1R-30]|uniref:GNAT family N-acetyltransferase n=1 Tax=Novosphingobium anseongense TaxID=3133436 RepID=A0ABU8RW94_9SPHN
MLVRDVIAGRETIVIDLNDDDGTAIGRLVPLTEAHLANDEVIGKLTDWRNASMGSFLTQFTATPERTRSWLRNAVFASTSQMMFLIYADDVLIGHFGFKDLTHETVLLDNAMRGERGGHPKLLQIAGRALIDWLFATAGVRTVTGYVLSTNPAAIMLNRAIGFDRWEKLSVRREEADGEVRLIVGEPGDVSPDGSYCYKLQKDAP